MIILTNLTTQGVPSLRQGNPAVSDANTVGGGSRMTSGKKQDVMLVLWNGRSSTMGKPNWIRNCSDLARHFCTRVLDNHPACYELQVIFDRYDIPMSLKSRTKRQAGQVPIMYHITDETHI